MAKVKKLEVDEAEREYLQQTFLDTFLKYKSFTAGCNEVQKILKESGDAESIIGQWVEDNPDFKVEFEKAKKIVDRVRAEKAEDFLNRMATGQFNKADGITTAHPVAAHMALEAFDKQKWSSKAPVDKHQKVDVIPRIEFHAHPGRPKGIKKKNDTDAAADTNNKDTSV